MLWKPAGTEEDWGRGSGQKGMASLPVLGGQGASWLMGGAAREGSAVTGGL